MNEGASGFQRLARTVAAAAKAVAEADRATAKTPAVPQAVQTTCDKAAEA